MEHAMALPSSIPSFMPPSMPSSCLLLSLADTPPGPYARRLNTAGRWAVHGTTQSPLLAWAATDAAGAQSAAERASPMHGKHVTVISGGDAGWVEGQDFTPFSEAFDAALCGPARQSEARTRRLRTEAEKLDAFCRVVRAASTAADHAAFAEIGRAASKALKAKFGGGSITSAFAWLAGSSGQNALESVLVGEVEPVGTLSLQQMAEAVALARNAERLQEGS